MRAQPIGWGTAMAGTLLCAFALGVLSANAGRKGRSPRRTMSWAIQPACVSRSRSATPATPFGRALASDNQHRARAGRVARRGRRSRLGMGPRRRFPARLRRSDSTPGVGVVDVYRPITPTHNHPLLTSFHLIAPRHLCDAWAIKFYLWMRR